MEKFVSFFEFSIIKKVIIKKEDKRKNDYYIIITRKLIKKVVIKICFHKPLCTRECNVKAHFWVNVFKQVKHWNGRAPKSFLKFFSIFCLFKFFVFCINKSFKLTCVWYK